MNYLNRLQLLNKLLLGFAVPAFVNVALSTLIYSSVNTMEKAFHWVEHTHQAIDYGNKLLSAMYSAP